jgi:hypothetical protein
MDEARRTSDTPSDRFVTDRDYQRLALRLRDLNSDGCKREKGPITTGITYEISLVSNLNDLSVDIRYLGC